MNVDLALARRIERAEAMANAATVEAHRSLEPACDAEWTEIGGLYAMFDGPDSPITQTFGLGVFEPFLAEEFRRAEEFFSGRSAATSHEVCAFAARESLALLSARGYSPIEASTVLVSSTTRDAGPTDTPVRVRPIGRDEIPVWSRTSGLGWGSESPELASFIEGFGVVLAHAHGVTCFLAELDGAPVAAAALNISNGVAILAGAATVPDARRKGAQNALLQARLAHAAARDIDIAMIVTQPGSASQRNAERQGFRPVYTRAKWQRPLGRAG